MAGRRPVIQLALRARVRRLIAATDPIAVVSLFKQLNVGHRLSTVVEAESLLNDGTSVVFFTLILAFVSGSSTSATSLLT